MSETPEDWPHQTRLRASDADRQHAVDDLTAAWRSGRLTREEFEGRVQRSFAATYLDELDALRSDVGDALRSDGGGAASGLGHSALVSPDAAAAGLPMEARQPEHGPGVARYAPDGSSGSAVSIGLLGGMDKVGDWIVAPVHASFAYWGGTTVDLRHAVFTSPDTTITCIAIMGGVEVIVPPEMEVRVTGVGVMGGFGWDKKRDARPTAQAPAGSPRVTINGLAFWGGVGVKRREREDPLD